MLDTKLKLLNDQGLIPGPEESETTFYNRVEGATTCAFNWNVVPTPFDFCPSWINVEFSNKGIPFWQAAVTWIEENGPRLQIKKGNFLGLYKKEEILSHEAVHAARFAFNEPQFEEILAYCTSKNAFRRFFGPLFQKSWESTCFVIVICLSFLPYLRLLPLLPLTFWLLRLIKNQRIFSKCRKKLSLPVLLRLTDKEIILFSQTDDIHSYIAAQTSLRWQMIKLCYFKE